MPKSKRGVCFVRKEAVVSSQIEGTQATLVDLLDFEALDTDDASPNPDIEEICNYLDALSYARSEFEKPDGNGRIGRLLIALLLESWGLLSRPLLYLSLYFKSHLDEYYRRLGAVRTEGDWEGWISFFLHGVHLISEEAIQSARELSALVKNDRERVLGVRHSTLAAARLFELLPFNPVLTVKRATTILDTTRPTAAKAVRTLIDAGVLTETSGRKRDQLFAYTDYLELLGRGTEL